MKDELDKLKQAFEKEPEIKASNRAKKIAMQSAIQAFEKTHKKSNVSEVLESGTEKNKKSENNYQGNFKHARQKNEDRKKTGLFNLLDWSNLMKHSYLFPVAAAGILAVSVFIFNPSVLHNKTRDEYLTQTSPQVLNKTIEANIATKKDIAKNDKTTSSGARDTTYENARQVDNINHEYVGGDTSTGFSVDDEGNLDTSFDSSSANSDISMSISGSKQHRTGTGLWAGYDLEGDDKGILGRGGQVNHNWISKNDNRKNAPYKKVPTYDINDTRRKNVAANNDKFEKIKTNSLKLTKNEPVSTFSVDVDTASYSFMRSSLNQGRLPQKDAVRVEELINYFPYDYAQAEDTSQPFKVSTTVMPTPWNADTKLLHIGIKGYDLPKQETPKSNLVFLLDTSGSMNQTNKLPLLINSFKLLLSTLQDDDMVSIVTYAGSAGTVLEPTKVKEKAKIIQALERLKAGGSTAGGKGIRLAYQHAEANYDKDAVNRVILATDGDFNVGIQNPEELKGFVEKKRKSGVYLSVLGFGKGNYNDALMQKLAQNGNGNAAYIDSLSEARKVLMEEASSTLFTIAKDVKIQMEFNPKTVSEYRLIGYETRALKREDFNNDKVDAGDIGAGHTVTAIYEITPVGSKSQSVDPLRYGEQDKATESKLDSKANQSEYGFLKLRYKLPNEDKSKLIETPILIADTAKSIDSTSIETRFATAVAAFGQLIRGGDYTESFNYDDVIELALNAKGEDLYGYRAEFINLVRLAKTTQSLQ